MTAATTPRGAARYDDFVAYIVKLCRAPGSRAALRRGLGKSPEQAYTMHSMIAWRVPATAFPATERAYYAVAAMIAAQARDAIEESNDALAVPVEEPSGDGELTPRDSLGVSFARAVARDENDRRAMKYETAEKRLHLLVRQSLPGLHRHLPGFVRHLRGLDVPVDWAQLIDDLSWWDRSRDRIAKRWLQDFYRTVQAISPKE